MSSSTQQKINDMLHKLSQERGGAAQPGGTGGGHSSPRPQLSLALGGDTSGSGGPRSTTRRPRNLPILERQNDNQETDRRLREIMKISGDLTLDGRLYKTDIADMEDMEELGNGTCGHVVKMRHRPSGRVIAVKQMRRSGNSDENKRIIMDIEVVLKSHDCRYIVQCLGCFITETEVWICMELMDTCFDKLLRRTGRPVPEDVLGKVTVATVEALSYLKDKHGVIHRDVKPSNILLDMKGNVKLCDFGISGRLVDSMAKTRSAGCAAYMAPERIEPDPQNPDYDVRADVWSLGISLVEMATGVFPYQDCKTDFEVLTKVIGQEPPRLPPDQDFSADFRDFVACCLIKEKKHRPKYAKLKGHSFIRKYETASVNVGDWYVRALLPQAVGDGGDPGTGPRQIPVRQFFGPGAVAAAAVVRPQQPAPAPPQPDVPAQRTDDRQQQRNSRLSAFREQRADGGAATAATFTYSPLRAYQSHLLSLQRQWAPSSPVPHRRAVGGTAAAATGGTTTTGGRSHSETRWRSPNDSPLPLRSQMAEKEPGVYNHGNTSPMVLQRFYHQQKQQQRDREAEEIGKKRYASYIKLNMDSGGRTSRHQSPDPPPRTSRGHSADGQSPLALRRPLLDAHPPSPALSRRYVSPVPPIPPPRRISESSSVPGSPQHVRARFHYTPEPQRRFFRADDTS